MYFWGHPGYALSKNAKASRSKIEKMNAEAKLMKTDEGGELGRILTLNKAIYPKNQFIISSTSFFLPQNTNKSHFKQNPKLFFFNTMKVNGDHSCQTRFSRQDYER